MCTYAYALKLIINQIEFDKTVGMQTDELILCFGWHVLNKNIIRKPFSK